MDYTKKRGRKVKVRRANRRNTTYRTNNKRVVVNNNPSIFPGVISIIAIIALVVITNFHTGNVNVNYEYSDYKQLPVDMLSPKDNEKRIRVAGGATAPVSLVGVDEDFILSDDRIQTRHITGYNAVSQQTDSTPCIAAAGYICDKVNNFYYDTNDIVFACPRVVPLGTRVSVEGVGLGTCLDRLAEKYDHRIDVLTPDLKTAYSVNYWREVIFYY